MELDINKIVDEKITSMLTNGEIEKLIATGVENNLKKAIQSATEDYNWKRTIEEGLEKVIGEVASKVNFSAYANFLRDRMNDQINRYAKNDMINLMRDSFEKVYLKVPENIKLSDILNKYKEYVEDNLDIDDKKEWGHIRFSFEREMSSFIKIIAGDPSKKRYGQHDKSLELELYIPSSSRAKARICWIRFDGNDFKTCMDFNRMSEFEVLMFNLMFTQREFEIDIDENFEWDTELEDEDNNEDW